MPGYDAMTADVNSRVSMSFSSQWPDSFKFVLAGTASLGTWIAIPSFIDFWPQVYWDIQLGGNVYRQNDNYYVGNNNYFIDADYYYLEYAYSGGRIFRVTSAYTGGTFRYAVTNLIVTD